MAGYKRSLELSPNQWWDLLSLAQKFSANSLFQFGYQLAFIRNTDKGKLAVLIREDNNLAAITEDGELDTHPNIVLRNQPSIGSQSKKAG